MVGKALPRDTAGTNAYGAENSVRSTKSSTKSPAQVQLRKIDLELNFWLGFWASLVSIFGREVDQKFNQKSSSSSI